MVRTESYHMDASVGFHPLSKNGFFAPSCADPSSWKGSPPFGLQSSGVLLVGHTCALSVAGGRKVPTAAVPHRYTRSG